MTLTWRQRRRRYRCSTEKRSTISICRERSVSWFVGFPSILNHQKRIKLIKTSVVVRNTLPSFRSKLQKMNNNRALICQRIKIWPKSIHHNQYYPNRQVITNLLIKLIMTYLMWVNKMSCLPHNSNKFSRRRNTQLNMNRR